MYFCNLNKINYYHILIFTFMKKFLSIVALFFAISFAYAQLPANSFAEDFTLLPINTTT